MRANTTSMPSKRWRVFDRTDAPARPPSGLRDRNHDLMSCECGPTLWANVSRWCLNGHDHGPVFTS